MNGLTAEKVRSLFEESPAAPEGIEFYDWWQFPADCYYARLPAPYEPRVSTNSGQLPENDFGLSAMVDIRPRLWLNASRPHAAVGWDAPTRQAVLFFGRGYGKLPPHAPAPPADIDRLAEQGTAFLEEERAARFRAMVRSLVEKLEADTQEMDIPWEERERIREMRRRVEDW